MDLIKHFLIPKHKVVYVYDDITIKEALETMESNRYSAIPIIDRNGNYIGTLSEGDLLWYLKRINFENYEEKNISVIPRLRDNQPLHEGSNSEILLSRASNENFVPIIDKNNHFVGIITRKEIIDYFFERKFIVL